MVTENKKPASEKKPIGEKKLDILEGELRLLKGEIKQSLSDVNSYLHSIKTPLLQQTDPFPGDEDRLGIDGALKVDSKESPVQPAALEPPVLSEQETPAAKEKPGSRPSPSAQNTVTTTSTPVNSEPAAIDSSLPESIETRRGEKTMSTEANPQKTMREAPPPEPVHRAPQVNLLANLIQWVHRAGKEIGVNRLPTFLDVYASTGTLSDEMRDVILKLADVLKSAGDGSNGHSRSISEQLETFLEIQSAGAPLTPEFKDSILRLVRSLEQKSPEVNISDVWSQLILELHGILSGGGTSARLINTPAAEKPAHLPVEKLTLTAKTLNEKYPDGKDKPFRLKLVMPFGEGVEKEFDVV